MAQILSAGLTPMCSLTPLLLVGFLVGTLVSSFTGSDAAGWATALAAVALTAAFRRVRGTPASCAVPPAYDGAARRRDP